ncbi:MAG: flavin reductase family protein [Marinomonas sp.]|uniref:flavin reductase family protein n=1 Tax=unclassified Marinomonas TaxID=196814 RepID=UPI0007AF224C|nr:MULTISPECIES: flavin reductase family protein [unclassified Marinomonas]KZM39573.1 flavin reductase [Marinomonas sp. SBI22]KZM41857.1 flavin reductase [Marinomonas sp. SBI8L]
MLNEDLYKKALGTFASGVTVVTAYDSQGKVTGLTASAFSALSMDPALVLVCPNYSSDTYPILSKAKRFAINILSAEQTDVAFAFAKKGEAKDAAISGLDISCSSLENPVIEGAVTVIECQLWREYEGGDHAILVGEVESIKINDEQTPMVYCQGKMAAWQGSN